MPIISTNAYAPIDVPNRLLVRGRMTPGKWLLLGVADWRSGFPYSTVDAALDYVGPRNVLRFPSTLRVELGIERKVRMLKWEPWVGVRVNNAFNAFLPTDVQANTSSPFFGNFYNSEIRQFRVNIRFGR